MKELVITTDDVNRYGFRLQSAGGKLESYERNPVLLFAHKSDEMPIGRVVNLRLEEGQLVGTPEFDEDDAEGVRAKSKYEKGFLNAASIWFDPIAYSEDTALMLPGQTGPTITEWELLEVSLVTVPGNRGATGLGYSVTQESVEAVRRLSFKQQSKTMLKQKLGLPETATEAEVAAAVEGLQNQLNVREADMLVAAAKVKGHLGTAEAEVAFRKLALADLASARDFVDKLAAAPGGGVQNRLGGQLRGVAPGQADDKEDRSKWTFADFQTKDPKGLLALKREDPDRYHQLAAVYQGMKF